MRSYNQIFNSMKNHIIANQDKITDFNEGSVITTLIESIAQEIELLYLSVNIAFKDRFIDLIYSIFEHKRDTPKPSTILVTFNKQIWGEVVTIPKNTRLITPDNIVFITENDTDIIIPGMSMLKEIACISETTGSQNNIPANTSIKFEKETPELKNVTLTIKEGGAGGRETESDDDYEYRFELLLKGLGGSEKSSIKNEVLKIPFVKDCNIYDISDNNVLNSKYFFTIIVAKQYNTNLTDKEHAEIVDVVEKFRACGCPCNIVSVKIKNVSIYLHIYYNKLGNKEQLLDRINSILSDFKNGIKIASKLYYNDIINKLTNEQFIENVIITGSGTGSYGDIINADEDEIIYPAFDVMLYVNE